MLTAILPSVSGWGTTRLAGILLFGAAASLAALTWVHWLPCAGSMLTMTPFDSEPPGEFGAACLARMDAGSGFPFFGDAALRTGLTDALRLTTMALLAAGLLVFIAGQAWGPRLRALASLPAFGTLLLMLQPAVPDSELFVRLFAGVSIGIEVSAAVALVAIIATVEAPRRYFVGCALLFVAATSAGFVHLLSDWANMAAFNDADWDTPPGTGYLTAAAAAIAAVLGALLVDQPRTTDAEASSAGILVSTASTVSTARPLRD